jgi:hypothetical protein
MGDAVVTGLERMNRSRGTAVLQVWWKCHGKAGSLAGSSRVQVRAATVCYVSSFLISIFLLFSFSTFFFSRAEDWEQRRFVSRWRRRLRPEIGLLAERIDR